jgi:hypothetical protein
MATTGPPPVIVIQRQGNGTAVASLGLGIAGGRPRVGPDPRCARPHLRIAGRDLPIRRPQGWARPLARVAVVLGIVGLVIASNPLS